MVTEDERPDPGGGAGGRALNATKHGILSRHAVLPWEDRAEFAALLTALVSEHRPVGPTEHHLVEEIAAIMWRKQRVLLAEAASHRAELQRRLEWDHHGLVRRAMPHSRARSLIWADPRAAVGSPTSAFEVELEELNTDEASVRATIEILEDVGADGYEEAMAALSYNVRAGWEEALLEEESAEDGRRVPEAGCRRPDGASLLRFLRNDALDWIRQQRREIEGGAQVRSQALGEALDVDRLDRIARYETHLARKLGRSLSMLMKLQEVRRTISAPAA